ncbi:hypothetical protein TorRG33x02_003040 [Trema orientale]|uniref:Uncharacterized protein n=1 Tax=Trema orientale TaxID=63057 RepID=A0A2P5G1S6_TREOI|nr:hypothetical protein TorRG33x02_003040 [Trema orientale]
MAFLTLVQHRTVHAIVTKVPLAGILHLLQFSNTVSHSTIPSSSNVTSDAISYEYENSPSIAASSIVSVPDDNLDSSIPVSVTVGDNLDSSISVTHDASARIPVISSVLHTMHKSCPDSIHSMHIRCQPGVFKPKSFSHWINYEPSIVLSGLAHPQWKQAMQEE